MCVVVVVFCWCVVVGGGGGGGVVWCGVLYFVRFVVLCCVFCVFDVFCVWWCVVVLWCGVCVWCVCVRMCGFLVVLKIFFVVRILMRQWQSGRLCMRYRKKMLRGLPKSRGEQSGFTDSRRWLNWFMLSSQEV